MALYNETSSYPAEIDDLIFYSDLDLKHRTIADKYYSLLAQKKYDEANELINSEEAKGLHGTFASFYNMLENRIYNLQQYVKPKTKREMVFYNTSPTEEQIQYGVIKIQ